MKHSIRTCITLLMLSWLSLTTSVAQEASHYTIDTNWAQLPDGGWDGATTWVAADGRGEILVMVRTPPYFRFFSREGKWLRSFGTEPEFRNAHSVTFDKDGFLWATDAGNHVIYKFSPSGELLQTLGTSGQAGDNASTALFNQPNDVRFAPNGDMYVSDGYVNARIVQFSPKGEFKRVIGGVEGSGAGQLKLPHGVALDSQGRLIVNDSDNKRISVFAPDGSFIEHWPFASRGGLQVTADDTVYVSDVNAGTISLLQDGQLLEAIKVDARPHSLTVDTDGAIYMSDAMGRKVYKITRKQ